MLVSVVVPAYKKETSIVTDITALYNTLVDTRFDFEIIVVEDGQLDDTCGVFTQYLADNPKLSEKIKFYSYKTNHGKGYAVRYGMARSAGDYIAFIDAGMEINPNSLSLLFEHMIWYDADIMVASKRHPASKTNITPLRKIYSWGYYTGVKILFGLKITDTQTGLKMYKREVLEKVLPRLVVKEYAFDIELLAVAKRLGYTRIFDAPVEVKLDFGATSKFSPFKPLFLDKFIREMFIDTLAVFYRLKLLHYYDDDSSRQWKFDEELMMRVNTGALGTGSVSSTINSSKLDTNYKCKFTVVIPVRNLNQHLKQNIINLQALPFKDYEVIVITDSEDEYDFKDARIKLIASGPIGPGEKRNIAALNSSGEILVFLDDDAYPASGWLSKAAEIFEDPEVYALGGPAMTPKGVSFLERCSGRVLEAVLTSSGTNHIHVPKASFGVQDFPSVNFFVRKSVFFEVGGFVTDFWPGEDTKLCLDLVQTTGKDILYSPEPVVFHHRRKLYKPHLKQYSRYGQHRGQFSRIFPETSRLPMYFVPSLFVLGLLLGPIVSFYFPMLWIPYFTVVLVYLAMVVYESILAAIKDRNLFTTPFVGLGIVLTHITYGIFFLIGLIRKPKLKLKNLDFQTGNYIGG